MAYPHRATALLEATPDGIITTNDTGIIESFNAAAERIFGYRRADALGKSLADLIGVTPMALRIRAASIMMAQPAASSTAIATSAVCASLAQ